MTKYYDKSTQELMIEYFKKINLQSEQEFKKQDITNWFNKNYPKIKNNTIQCHLIKLSVNANSRKHYNPSDDGQDDILYQINSNTFKLYDKIKDGIIFSPVNIKSVDDDKVSQEFAYEKDLQNYLSKNLSIIEPGLKVFDDDGIIGIEYPIYGRFIDILALDKENNFVIIELKVSKGYDKVIGQLLLYKSLIKKYLSEKDQKVRGMIICKEITDDLRLACSDINDIELFEYELSIKLQKKEI